MCIANLNCGLQKKQAQFLVKSMCTNSSIENYLMKSDELDLTLQDFYPNSENWSYNKDKNMKPNRRTSHN